MPHARFDDRYDDHKKIKRAWRRAPAAVGLHAMAITYCNRHISDGLVDVDWIDEKLAALPLKPREQQAVLATAIELKLLERIDDETYLVHDFLDWNLSKAQRKAFAEQGKRGGHAKAAGHSQSSSEGSSQGQSVGHSESSGTPLATPLATPVPSTTPEEKPHPDVVALSERLAVRVRSNDNKTDPNPHSKRWLSDMRLLLRDRDGDVAEVERVIDWCQADGFWRSNILSPAKLRKQFTQLLLRAQAGSVHQIGRKPNASDLLRAINGDAA